MKVFRPSRIIAYVLALAGAPIAFTGAACLYFGIYSGRSSRDWDEYLFCWGCFLFGSFIVMSGLAMSTFRIVVDREGIARSSWFGLITYRDKWKSLKAWTLGRVDDQEMENRFFVEFEFETRRLPVRIEHSLVANPGFEAFLAEVRRHSGTKEKANPPVENQLAEYVNS